VYQYYEAADSEPASTVPHPHHSQTPRFSNTAPPAVQKIE